MNPTGDPLPDLIRRLGGPTPADRIQAVRDLGRLGGLARDALPGLVRAAADPDPKVREAAAQAAGQMGPSSVPALARLLLSPDKYVRRHAVWGLGRLGPAAAVALPDLCRALKDADPRTASGAAQAVGALGADGAGGIDPLAEAMRGTNVVLCRLAARALSQIGPPALPTLIAHLGHHDPFVRGESALAVGWMGADARAAVPALAAVVRGPNSAAAVADLPDDGYDTPTGTPADPGPPEESCRVYAAQSLGRMGPVAVGAAEELRHAARTGPAAVRQAARQALQRVEPA